ncbi:nucleotidyltransferase domain-containing protein [Vulcanococcus limneticus]|uniref:nucleotidyltransferase domain-containing protein n=1 Tax=Vulcanococcus limneticus TaxID=2170428 RepID=UPI0018E3C7FC|nr:nucleotidyltransferase domain-containing protein [Vulcanococcus limneticus]
MVRQSGLTDGRRYAAIVTPGLSPLERLRQARQQGWLADRRQAVAEVLAGGDGLDGVPCLVLLFGSRARGDWDGYSDTDLLVVAQARQQADRLANLLLQAGVGDDVIAMSLADWQAAAHSPSPHWRSIHAQAIPLYERPSPGLVVSG